MERTNTITASLEMYLELSEQKEEQEKRRNENVPRERNFSEEHEEALRRSRYVVKVIGLFLVFSCPNRNQEASGEIRQCNEGKVVFWITLWY